MKSYDARGLSCPQPVIMLKQALLESPDGCCLIVDNPIARENTARFGSHMGYQHSVEEKDHEFYLTFYKE